MRLFGRYYKRLKITYIKSAWLSLFVAALFLPSYQKLEREGDNFFIVSLNNEVVGTVESEQAAEKYLIQARKNIAKDSTSLVLASADLSYEGQEKLYGYVDSEESVVANMEKVLLENEKQTLKRAYTVKINQYTANLSSLDEVKALLQAAIDKYDTEHKYGVDLHLDNSRELTALTAEVVRNDELDEQENTPEANYFGNVGIYAAIDEMFAQAGATKELDFEDYELGIVSLQFDDKIEVVESYLLDEEIISLDQAINEVTKDQEKEQIYEVKSGDTLSEIAEYVDIPVDDLVAMNSILSDENVTIRPGDELVITVPQPELSIVRQEEIYTEAAYEEEIVYVPNDEWYTTQTKVLQEPSAGYRKAISLVTYKDNQEIETEVLKQEITYQAVAKIVERGTKIPPTYVKPISGGRLTSGFGRRSRPTRGASSYHKGVDWAVPKGTAVMASCGGVVTRAGWGSGYGYCVYIRHADGRETRYGHLSKVLVSTGQTVSQGQKIALSGNTGVSTGPHLHFEILINGSQVNPLKYLN